jgi:hypothetical protein
VRNMAGRPLTDEVLEELGAERLQRLAGLLGTEPEATRRIVSVAVLSLTGRLTDDTATPGVTAELCQAMVGAAVESDPPPGTAAAGSVMIAAVLDRVTGSAARAVAARMGLAETAVGSALEIVVPVTADVLARRARS